MLGAELEKKLLTSIAEHRPDVGFCTITKVDDVFLGRFSIASACSFVALRIGRVLSGNIRCLLTATGSSRRMGGNRHCSGTKQSSATLIDIQSATLRLDVVISA